VAQRERVICASHDLVDGGDGVRFEVADGGGQKSAFVIRHCGRVHAYANRCGHVPVELDWQHGRFFDMTGLYLICATHGALYEPATGRCVGGRCNGKGLEPLAVLEHGGSVYFLEG
jgi:nitrite reductase/ring-hydroxylating ferredoxin subunit